jgi:predicted dehydrogenase
MSPIVPATSPGNVPYLPHDPPVLDQPIGLIGCGGISHHHLTAYRAAGYPVVALCDTEFARADARRSEYFPDAAVFADYRELLRRDDIRVVDVATHPAIRSEIITAALDAKKHVLSQKPFVLDLQEGLRLVEHAERQGVLLAVNQNGRWAPHFSYLLGASRAGLLGDLATVHLSVHWDHSWVAGTEFAKIRHLILYDYAIHWFDLVNALLTPRRARRVYACLSRSPWQTIMPPLQAQAVIEYDDVQVSLAFDGNTLFGSQDRTYVTGSRGTLFSCGPGNRVQRVTMTTADGEFRPALRGSWFPDGFHGTMGELLCSIAEKRTPSIDARRNLDSLALCFAAVAGADRHEPVVPGSVQRLPH